MSSEYKVQLQNGQVAPGVKHFPFGIEQGCQTDPGGGCDSVSSMLINVHEHFPSLAELKLKE